MLAFSFETEWERWYHTMIILSMGLVLEVVMHAVFNLHGSNRCF